MDANAEQQQQRETLAQFLEKRPSRSREIEAAVHFRTTRRRRSLVHTIVLKLRTQSRRKETLLLKWQGHITNLKAEILQRLAENPSVFQTGHLIDIVTRTLREKPEWKDGERTKAIGARIYQQLVSKRPPEVEPVSSYPISNTLVDGAFRDVATAALNWLQNVIDEVDLSQTPPYEMHQRWATALAAYEEAKRQEMPFGWRRGEALDVVGKGSLRWLLERVPEYEDVVVSLEDVNVLLNQKLYPESQVLEAKRRQHLWRTISSRNGRNANGPNHEQAVRADWVDQHRLQKGKKYVLLGSLQKAELETYEDQLLERYELNPEFELIRAAIDLLLAPRSPRYPVVESVVVTDEGQVQSASLVDLEREVELALDRLSRPFPQKDQAGRRYSQQEIQDLERERQNELLRALGKLLPPRLQPLHFVRTIHQKFDGSLYDRGFCLLYSVNEKHPKIRYSILLELHREDPPMEPDPNIPQKLYFVDNPDAQLVVPPGRKLMIIPVECGYEYHDEPILREVIERRRDQQQRWQERLQQRQEQENNDKDKKGPRVLRASLGDARVSSQLNSAGHREFFAHLSVRVPVPPCKNRPQTIIGIHEHANGYSFAILSLSGEVMKLGNLRIPDEVRPKATALYYPENYVPVVANRIVRLALPRDALIGLEHTGWKKNQRSLSHDINRLIRNRPSEDLAKTLADKAELAQLCSIWRTGGVSPAHTCSRCGETSDVSRCLPQETRVCHEPSCASSLLLGRLRDGLIACLSCQQLWEQRELYFSCALCGWTQLAMYNTATVVAHLTLKQVYEYHQREQEEKTKRRERKRTTPIRPKRRISPS